MVPELGAMLPALLDALGHVGTGVTVVADRGNGFERWYANAAAAALLGYTVDELRAMPGDRDDRPRAARADRRSCRRAFAPASRSRRRSSSPRCTRTARLVPIELAIGHFRDPRRAGLRHGACATSARTSSPAVAARGRSHRPGRRAVRRLRARDQQPADLGAAQPALAAQAAAVEPARRGPAAGDALPRRHHDRRRADREQRARAADARDPQRDRRRSISRRWCRRRCGSPRRRSSRAPT